MRFYPGEPDHQPIRYFGRVPVFAATIIAVLYCAGMVVKVTLDTAHATLAPWVFDAEMFYRHGHLWQVLTYSFVNDPNFFFLFGIFFLFQFGSELEQYFGRRTFLKLYALNLFTPALVLGAWYLAGRPTAFAGMYEITAAQFIAYVTLYPNLEFFGWVPMKYVAFACLAISGLSYLQHSDWEGLSVLAVDCAASFGFVRYLKHGGSVEFGEWARRLNPFRRRGKFRVLPTPSGSRPPMDSPSGTNMVSVDAILDKIARTGFASLTQDERDQLERAREILNKKKQ